MTKPVQVKTTLNGSNPSGTVWAKGRVLGVDGTIAQVQLTTNQIVTVRVDMLRGKSGAPKAGEVWILDQVYGQWLFSVPVGVLGVDLTTGGTGGGGSTPPPSGPTQLSQLTDVAIANPLDAQVLTYDIATSKWKNKPVPTPIIPAVPQLKPFMGIAERAMGFIEYQMRPFGMGAGNDAIPVLSRQYPITYTGSIVGYFDPGTGWASSNTLFGGNTPVYQAQLTLTTSSGITATAATSAVGSDGSFTFSSAAYNGLKSVRIIDTANGNTVVADSMKSQGLARSIQVLYGNSGSYNFPPTNYTGMDDSRTYAYDQGLALMAAMAMGRNEMARRLYYGLARMQVLASGATQFQAPVYTEQLTPGISPGIFRLLDSSMAFHAVGNYARSFGEEIFHLGPPFTNSAMNTYATAFPLSGGLYVSGTGTYPTSPVGYVPYGDELAANTYSAEANMMAWFALTSLRENIQAGPYESMAALQSNIVSKLWNTQLLRFNRNTGNSTADTLRARILGYFFMHAIGRDDVAPAIITDTALTPFKHTSPITGAKGYSAYFHSTDYTGSIYPIWMEGTCALALAFLISGDTARWAQTLSDLFVLTPGLDVQDETGDFPRASVGKYVRDSQRIQSNNGGMHYTVPDTSNDFSFGTGGNAQNLYWSVSSAAMAVLAICGGGIFGV
jgi:hypothetical protein